MAFENKSSFADIIAYCSDTKSDIGCSSLTSHKDISVETLSVHSKSSFDFNEENVWASPVEKEAIELSSRKRFAVLNMIEKNWKVNIRSKIESDLRSQVQEALAPFNANQKRWSEKKKEERRKNMQMLKFNNFSRSRFTTRYAPGAGGGSFKYIDVDYTPPHHVAAEYSKENLHRSIGNFRLTAGAGDPSHEGIYRSDEIDRARRHKMNLRGGLDITLLDSHDNFLSLPKQGAGHNGLRPLIPNVINYSGISLPNYGSNRRCFQTYSKEGMSNLLNSRSRRSKLTHLGGGKYLDKRGIIISRLGPFWPQGYGPVCQCPEFITSCPSQEDLTTIGE